MTISPMTTAVPVTSGVPDVTGAAADDATPGGFAALVAINSMGWLPKLAVTTVTGLSSWCLVTAIAALGMKTSFKDVAAVGWRPIAMMVGILIGALLFAIVFAAIFLIKPQ